jgi:MFS family permease
MSRTIGHYAHWYLAALVCGLMVLTVAPAAGAFVPWPAMVLLIAVAVLLGLSMLAHNRRLCERCMAALPLDASAVAARYRLRFRVAHLFERRLFALGYLTTLLGSSLMAADPVGRYLWALAEASLVYLLLVYVTHQRLQPWCPYCRHGGEEQTTPTTPSPVSTEV